jgi:hypothetical protein
MRGESPYLAIGEDLKRRACLRDISMCGGNIRTDREIGSDGVDLTGSELVSVAKWNEQGDGPLWSIKQGIFLIR